MYIMHTNAHGTNLYNDESTYHIGLQRLLVNIVVGVQLSCENHIRKGKKDTQIDNFIDLYWFQNEV
jgi:hypothetical protein